MRPIEAVSVETFMVFLTIRLIKKGTAIHHMTAWVLKSTVGENQGVKKKRVSSTKANPTLASAQKSKTLTTLKLIKLRDVQPKAKV